MNEYLNDLFTLIKIYNPEDKPMTTEALKALVEKIPIVPVRFGEWLATGRINPLTDELEYECAYCHRTACKKTLYCPSCGAKNIND
jgi:hypothetical protein